MEKVFFPINIVDSHWFTIVAYVREKRLMYLDSSKYKICRFSHLTRVQRYLMAEHKHKLGREMNIKEWKLGREDSPAQDDGCSCGVHVAMNIDLLLRNLPLQYKGNLVQEYRKTMAVSLLRKEYPRLSKDGLLPLRRKRKYVQLLLFPFRVRTNLILI